MSALGVFDSGLGGLTVVKELRASFPNEDILYLGDTARVPYGSKSARTVERYALRCQDFLLAKGVKLMVVACNTASATAIPAMQSQSSVRVIGAVEPGAKAACAASETGVIGVLGTLATTRSGAYERAISALRPEAKVGTKACPLFVPLAEEGWGDNEIAEAVANRYLSELAEEMPDLDTLVLGCTHYPLLRSVVAKACSAIFSQSVSIVDSAETMALECSSLLTAPAQEQDPRAEGRLSCFFTDATRMEELGPRFLGEELSSIELIDL